MNHKKKEYCSRGHKRDDRGTFIDSSGYAQCRECMLIRGRNYRKKKREAGFKLIHGRWIKDPVGENLLAPALEEILYPKKGKKK